MRICGVVALALLLLALFLLGLFLLIPVPLVLFQKIVNSQVYLQRKEDGQLPTGTYFWSRLPAIEYYTFYFFNVSNPDEVVYHGAVPNLIEVGPYVYAETEFKEYMEWNDNDNVVFFQNNKSWVYNQERSCTACSHDDILIMPNVAYMTTVFMNIQQPMAPVALFGVDLLTLLLGEGPLRYVPMAGVLFESYPDPFLSLINSNFTKLIMNVLGNPIELPQIPAMGYFPLYNHTNDGNYTMKTGKDNTDNVGLITSWSNYTHLPWWKSETSQDITNSGDGSFQKPDLKKTDALKQFQSFTCRAFFLHFSGNDTTLSGIQAYEFKVDDNTYDSFVDTGYQYENLEKINYWPDWPCGPNHTYAPDRRCGGVDCTLLPNFCSPCCNGSYVNGTYLLPPGIIPLRCLPGQLVVPPFAGFLSPPHYALSPKEVTTSLPGLAPDLNKHHPGKFYINPTTGSTIGAVFRMQLSVPMFKTPGFTSVQNIMNAFTPTFWVEINIQMRDYATSYLRLTTATLPKIILGLGIGFVVVSVIAFLILTFCIVRHRRGRSKRQAAKRANNMNAWAPDDHPEIAHS